ncbi:hypothetical protein Echvi_3243 [Echinicola vietnamensis DSM 17526]|uniref:Uncharacterized protein n=1 Tax=Echinicola vietnamensis (strain DSM 17526 / LMG 23754 / KMM 6221) TaxID=926556 RepID=L0FZV5_ECHVK|nr:hypothetical protein Echvi_3243 [Echinicola vietnamensis DSM 17526]
MPLKPWFSSTGQTPLKNMFLFAFISAVPTELTHLCVIILVQVVTCTFCMTLRQRRIRQDAQLLAHIQGLTSAKPTIMHEQIAATACTIQINKSFFQAIPPFGTIGYCGFQCTNRGKVPAAR